MSRTIYKIYTQTETGHQSIHEMTGTSINSMWSKIRELYGNSIVKIVSNPAEGVFHEVNIPTHTVPKKKR